jgi:two-component sensor histidine kinase
VEFAEYARNLSSQLINTYSLSPGQIRLATDMEPVRIGIDLAVPCGLILNELVSNAVKHAFGAGPGEIRVRLRRIEQGRCVLGVADNGVGLPDGLDLETATSLGLRLIRSLTRQIGGQFELLPGRPGTDARLTLPFDSYAR